MFGQLTILTIDNSTTGNKLEIEHPSNMTTPFPNYTSLFTGCQNLPKGLHTILDCY